jgi:acyl carrier protein
MLDKQILDTIREALEGIEIQELEVINEDTRLKDDLCFEDEYIVSEVMIALEDEFDISIDEVDLLEKIENNELETIDDLIEYITSIVNENNDDED